MFGAIIGDVVGSIYEFENHKGKDFQFLKSYNYYIDDTVMTIAIADALMSCKEDYSDLSEVTEQKMKYYYSKYPTKGYGHDFKKWLTSKVTGPYNSFGNGAGMRVSPVAWVAKDIDECKFLSRKVTEITHSHPEGIKGAEAVSVCVWMAIHGHTKDEIISYVTENYYNLPDDYEDLVWCYEWDSSCQGTVPQAIACFVFGENFEDCVKNAVSIGGDSDTLACITGSIAEPYYKESDAYKKAMEYYLDDELIEVVKRFMKKVEEKL